jgi:hypothetical protein
MVLDNFVALVDGLGFKILGLTFSPVKGPEGNIEFLGQLVKITETSNGIKVYIGEDKNYPAPSASITSLSGNSVKSYYLYDNGNTWPSGTANWGETYANCSNVLKDRNDEDSAWNLINISIAGVGDPDIHKNKKGFNIPNNYTLKVTIKINLGQGL